MEKFEERKGKRKISDKDLTRIWDTSSVNDKQTDFMTQDPGEQQLIKNNKSTVESTMDESLRNEMKDIFLSMEWE